MRRATYGKGAKGKATRLHSLVVRARGMCEVEGCGENRYEKLQTAHIRPRRYAATRTDERNAFCLCAKHAMRFTEHADEWMDFVDSTIGREEYNRLKAKADAPIKTSEAFWLAECERLKALLAEAEAA